MDPWVGKIPWRRERLPTPVFWPGGFHGLYSPWGCKESDMTEKLSLSATGEPCGAWQTKLQRSGVGLLLTACRFPGKPGLSPSEVKSNATCEWRGDSDEGGAPWGTLVLRLCWRKGIAGVILHLLLTGCLVGFLKLLISS